MNKTTLVIVALVSTATAMIAGVTLSSYSVVQHAFAAKTKSFCYSFGIGIAPTCFDNKGECTKAQRADHTSNGGCFERNT